MIAYISDCAVRDVLFLYISEEAQYELLLVVTVAIFMLLLSGKEESNGDQPLTTVVTNT